MKKSILKNYAKLIAETGLNVQKGQDVVVEASLDQEVFVSYVVEALYKRGARKVFVNFTSPLITKLNIKHQKLKDLSTLETFEIDKWNYIKDKLSCRLFIESDDPDALNGIDINKLAKANCEKMKIIKPIRNEFDNKIQWCIVGVPSLKWAKKVFPNLSNKKAIEALWEAILKVSRSYEGNPIENWEKHDKNLQDRKAYLNSLHLHYLEYKSKNGTDFKVELLPNVKWGAGGEVTKDSKIYFQPNIPSEEVFTSPKSGSCEGVVVSTKPLSLNGHLVEDFKIYFKNGRVDKIEAKKGKEVLEELVKMDEGSSKLGEVALIPYHSPINEAGLLFFSTLYDENASCHLALGAGFESLMDNYENMSNEEIHKKGINDSINHVDFMIGSEDMAIIGTDFNGEKHIIFENGDFKNV